MDEMAIIKILAANIDHKEFPYQMARCFIYGWECDYWTMKENGETREFEIKISRSDYFNDAKKDKHKSDKGANYFYYVVPVGLIRKEEVDKKYGLIYIAQGGQIRIEKKPQRLNYNAFDNWKMLASKFYWKFRDLWREKWIDKEITRDEYFDGLQAELNLEEPA